MVTGRAHLAALERPRPGAAPAPSRLDALRLDKNECADPAFARRLHQAVAGAITPEDLTAYPETDLLYHKLADRLGLGVDSLYLAAGSDGAIRAVFQAFVAPGDRVLVPEPTFAMYPVYCDMFQAERIPLPYGADLTVSLDAAREALAQGARVWVLPNPDSPTGAAHTPKVLRSAVEAAARAGTIVLVDEAYYPYFPHTALGWVGEFDNLVVVQTFSKAWALAGHRVGFAAAAPGLTRFLHAQKPMYEIGQASVKAACVALDHESDMRASVARTLAGKAWFAAALRERGLRVREGHANFLLVDFGPRREAVVGRLQAAGVLFKASFPHAALAGYARISAAPRPVLEPVLACIDEAMAE